MADATKDVKVRVLVEGKDQSGPALNAASQGLKKFKENLQLAQQAAAQLTMIGLKLSAMGAAISAAVVFPVKSAMDFQQQMSGVLAVTAGAQENFQLLAETAKDLGAKTKFSATQAAEGLRLLGMAGLSAKEAADALAPSLDLAAAGELEVAEAADIATNIMSAMGLEVEDLTHVMDVLGNTATSSNTTVREMAEALKYAAPIAASAGIDIDQLAAIIGVLANNGIKGTMAGTSLRGMIIALASPTSKAEKAFEKLNVQVSKNVDGTIDYLKTLTDLHNAGMGVTEATDIFRRTAASSALATAKATAEVYKLEEANRFAMGTIKKMADIMLDNLAGAMVRLKSATEGVLIALGDPLQNTLQYAIDSFSRFLIKVKDLIEKYPKITFAIMASIGTFGLVVTAIGGLTLTFGLLAGMVLNIISLYTTLIAMPIVATFIAWASQLTVVTLVTQGLIPWLIVLKAEFLALSLVMKFSVIGIFVATAAAIAFTIKALVEWGVAVNQNKVAAEAWGERMKSLEKYRKTEMKSIEQVTELNYEEAKSYAVALKGKIKYLTAAVAQKERLGEATEKEVAALDKAQEAYRQVWGHIRDIKPLSESVGESFRDLEVSVEEGEKALAVMKKQFLAIEEAAKKAYDVAISEVEKYAQKVIEWEEKIKNAKKTTEELLRSLKRKTLTEEEKWNDRRAEAEENLAKMRELLAEGTEKSMQEAFKLGEQVKRQFAGLATEVTEKNKDAADTTIKTLEETVQAAEEGIREVQTVQEEIQTSLAETYQRTSEDAKNKAEELKKKLDELAEKREAIIDVQLENIDDARRELEQLKEDFSEIEVEVKIRESMSMGGPVFGMATGGKLPGDSKKDSIPVLARPGEWFIRNEAAKFWQSMFGSDFMAGINNPMSNAGRQIKNMLTAIPKFNLGGAVQSILPRFAEGGRVGVDLGNMIYEIKDSFQDMVEEVAQKLQAPATPAGGRDLGIKNLGRMEIAVGANAYPVIGEVDALSQLKDAIEREQLVRSNS